MSRFQLSVTSEASGTPMRQLLKMINRLLKTAVLLLLLLGCNPGGAPSDAAQTPPAVVAHATTTSPETTAAKGALTGVLLLKTDDGLKPVADIKIAIGQTLRDDEGAERIVAYEPSTAPVAYTDAAGRFVFEELPIGTLRPHPRRRAERLPVVQGRNARRHPLRDNGRRSDRPGDASNTRSCPCPSHTGDRRGRTAGKEKNARPGKTTPFARRRAPASRLAVRDQPLGPKRGRQPPNPFPRSPRPCCSQSTAAGSFFPETPSGAKGGPAR